MTSLSFRTLAAAMAPLSAGLSLAGEEPAPRRPPNVVIILADDLGAECLSSHGGTSYRTPNLDALARSGIRFDSACATPLCSPSRVQLMTGRYGFRTGWTRLIGSDTPAFLDPRERTFGHVLGAAGYATALAGKWQLANFRERPDHVKECGFDEYCAWTWVIDGKKPSRYWDPAIWQDGKLRKDTAGRYGEDVFADFLIDFMRRNRSRPFLAYYPMVLVHAPYDPTPAQPGAARDAGRRRGARENFPAMVEYMDATVGRIVRAVEELGLLEHTLIIFTADNGTPRDITSRMGPLEVRGGKGQVTHVGTHVPFIASWKGVTPPGRVAADVIDLSDVLPTVADLAGAPPPGGVTIDGQSFAPQLRGERGSPREWVYSQLGEARFARDRRWILHGDGRLHDLEADPFEKKDLAESADPAAAAARRRLQAALEGLRQPG